MEPNEAMGLIRSAVPAAGGVWADFGAGSGTFSHALAALLGPQGRVLAVDRDAGALRALPGTGGEARASMVPVSGDFRDLGRIPELDGVALDGALFANSLHFVPDAGRVLREAAHRLRPRGRIVVVEYDGRSPSRWVPYPIGRDRLAALAVDAGLERPRAAGERPSAYGGMLYAAWMGRREGEPLPGASASG